MLFPPSQLQLLSGGQKLSFRRNAAKARSKASSQDARVSDQSILQGKITL